MQGIGTEHKQGCLETHLYVLGMSIDISRTKGVDSLHVLGAVALRRYRRQGLDARRMKGVDAERVKGVDPERM